MNSGAELSRLLRRAGATLVKQNGHHEIWQLNGKTFRVSNSGRRPGHIVRSLLREIRRAARLAQEGGA